DVGVRQLGLPAGLGGGDDVAAGEGVEPGQVHGPRDPACPARERRLAQVLGARARVGDHQPVLAQSTGELLGGDEAPWTGGGLEARGAGRYRPALDRAAVLHPGVPAAVEDPDVLVAEVLERPE